MPTKPSEPTVATSTRIRPASSSSLTPRRSPERRPRGCARWVAAGRACWSSRTFADAARDARSLHPSATAADCASVCDGCRSAWCLRRTWPSQQESLRLFHVWPSLPRPCALEPWRIRHRRSPRCWARPSGDVDLPCTLSKAESWPSLKRHVPNHQPSSIQTVAPLSLVRRSLSRSSTRQMTSRRRWRARSSSPRPALQREQAARSPTRSGDPAGARCRRGTCRPDSGVEHRPGEKRVRESWKRRPRHRGEQGERSSRSMRESIRVNER